MKSWIPIVVFSGLAAFSRAAEHSDPFAEPVVVPIDRSGDKRSDKFLSDQLLKAFEESRLDNGVGKGREVIRITVLRSFDAPVMFKWFPAPLGQVSELEVKRLKVVVGADGARSYQGMDFHQRLKLRPTQEGLLKEIYEHSPLQELPQTDWTAEGLDGSDWIYEAAAEKGSIRIARWSPINPVVEGTKIDPKRLSKELQLTTFALMLWTLSGIDERPY